MELFRKIIKKIIHIGSDTVDDYRKRGVIIGEGTSIYACDIDYGHGYLIEIGKNCTITHTTILSHDASTKMFIGYSKVGRVIIGDNVFIGQGSIIFPGITIGNRVIIGANSVVRESIPDNSVCAGNPAKMICTIDEFIEKHKDKMKTAPVYNTYWENKTDEEKEKERIELSNCIGYDI